MGQNLIFTYYPDWKPPSIYNSLQYRNLIYDCLGFWFEYSEVSTLNVSYQYFLFNCPPFILFPTLIDHCFYLSNFRTCLSKCISQSTWNTPPVSKYHPEGWASAKNGISGYPGAFALTVGSVALLALGVSVTVNVLKHPQHWDPLN